MKIGRPFRTLTKTEYLSYIDQYKKYTDFNTLGLYRSILENEKLDLETKLAVRDYAHRQFRKAFDFLQLKDPATYFELNTLGQELTVADSRQLWQNIRVNQQKILAEKRIQHRNFGDYSKHNCGYADCPLDGLMIRQGSPLMESHMHFRSDRNRDAAKDKSRRLEKDQKKSRQAIRREIQENSNED